MNAGVAQIGSSSSAESTMDEISNAQNNRRRRRRRREMLIKAQSSKALVEADGDDDMEEGDPEVWRSVNHSLQEVQSVLDRNRVLIQQVNQNHQSRIHDNMVKNVALINEINGNVSKVVSLYSDMSVNFSGRFHEQNAGIQANHNKSNS